MLHIPLDRTAKRTYTKQIYYAIRQKILSGELTAGEALPPYRELSRELGVSKNTVLSAYDMLVADGVLRSTAGSGFYGAKQAITLAHLTLSCFDLSLFCSTLTIDAEPFSQLLCPHFCRFTLFRRALRRR